MVVVLAMLAVLAVLVVAVIVVEQSTKSNSWMGQLEKACAKVQHISSLQRPE